MKRIGVYVCHCGSNIAGYLDVEKLTDFSSRLPSVVLSRHYTFMCSNKGQDFIKEDIRQLGLTGILVCSCSPTLHLGTFRRACAEAGLNPYLCEMVTIREFCSWVHSHDSDIALKKAMALVSAGVRRVSHNIPLLTTYASVTPNVLIVGAGIAGIQVALETANILERVYLVEKEPAIGGRMAQLDTTFPDFDSASELLSSKLELLKEINNIDVFTNSEVTELSGYIGNFKAKIKKKARFVDEKKCNGCGECLEKCPVEFLSTIDSNTRKAIDFPTAQTSGTVPVIDPRKCKFFIDKSCHLCADICPTKAIDFYQTEELVEVNVGACVVATGSDIFDPSPITDLGYGVLDNVITSLEFERILRFDGPTKGIIQLKDGKIPRSVLIAHCIGSRDQNYFAHCSRVCCMYSLKYARIIKQRLGPEVDVYETYIDMRCFGKEHEEFYKKASEDNVTFIRGKICEISNSPENQFEKDKLVAVVEETLLGKVIRIPVDMVILSVAMRPKTDAEQVARTFLLGRSSDGFFLERHPKLDPVGTMVEGIFSVGCCQGPKDISDTTAQASGAGARVQELVRKAKVEMEAATAVVDEEVCSGCGYCISACAYNAIELDPKTGLAKVNKVNCKGCGACSAICPSKAMQLANLTHKEMIDVIDEATREFEMVSI